MNNYEQIASSGSVVGGGVDRQIESMYSILVNISSELVNIKGMMQANRRHFPQHHNNTQHPQSNNINEQPQNNNNAQKIDESEAYKLLIADEVILRLL